MNIWLQRQQQLPILLKITVGITSKKIISSLQTNNSNNKKFEGQYVSFIIIIIIIIVFDWKWLNEFIFIYKHYINSHAKTQDHICLISIGQKRTCKSGHLRSKPKCCLTFLIADIIAILCESAVSLTSQPPVCHESIPKQGANALWHQNLASNFIHEDRLPRHQGCHPRHVLAPALQQNRLLNRHGIFYFGVIDSSCQFSLKLSDAKRLYKTAYLSNPKTAYLSNPKRKTYKDTYSIKYIFSPASGKVT